MGTKAHADGEQSADVRQQMSRLYERLVHWLYERQNVRRAVPVAEELARLLASFGPRPESIFVEECRSLVHEARGDLGRAIKHREDEIRLIRRLHRAARNTGDADSLFQLYSYADLCDRLQLLAMLQHNHGDLKAALRALRECKRLCAAHGMAFDGEDLLRAYQEETRKALAK
jgi:hypothetical protein